MVSSRWVEGLSTGRRPVSAMITMASATKASRLPGDTSCSGLFAVAETMAARLADSPGTDRANNPEQLVSPGSLLAFVALAIVIIAETGRLPVDNPSTHLELTMIHEAMVLEYAGPKLALVEWASGMRLTVLLGLVANLFMPWGIAGADPSLLAVLIGLASITVKVVVLAGLLAAGEVFIAKLRLFRVPELLAGSFLLALLAVTASYFLGTPTS